MPAPWLNRGIKAVFFDAVGTLLHPADPVASTYRSIALRHGADLDETVIRGRLLKSFLAQERRDLQSGWKTSEEREAERWRLIVHEALPETASTDACFFDLWEWYRLPAAWRLHPGTGAVLGELRQRGLLLGMASNFDARLAPIVAAFADLAPLASRVAISSLVGSRKPSPEFFGEVVRLAGCRAENILFVGDDLRNDYEGASTAGLQAVLFDPAGKGEGPERIATLLELL